MGWCYLLVAKWLRNVPFFKDPNVYLACKSESTRSIEIGVWKPYFVIWWEWEGYFLQFIFPWSPRIWYRPTTSNKQAYFYTQKPRCNGCKVINCGIETWKSHTIILPLRWVRISPYIWTVIYWLRVMYSMLSFLFTLNVQVRAWTITKYHDYGRWKRNMFIFNKKPIRCWQTIVLIVSLHLGLLPVGLNHLA